MMFNKQNKLLIFVVNNKKEVIEDFNKKLPTKNLIELSQKVMRMATWVK